MVSLASSLFCLLRKIKANSIKLRLQIIAHFTSYWYSYYSSWSYSRWAQYQPSHLSSYPNWWTHGDEMQLLVNYCHLPAYTDPWCWIGFISWGVAGSFRAFVRIGLLLSEAIEYLFPTWPQGFWVFYVFKLIYVIVIYKFRWIGWGKFIWKIWGRRAYKLGSMEIE